METHRKLLAAIKSNPLIAEEMAWYGYYILRHEEEKALGHLANAMQLAGVMGYGVERDSK